MIDTDEIRRVYESCGEDTLKGFVEALLAALEEASTLLLRIEGKLVVEGALYGTDPMGVELRAWRRNAVKSIGERT